MLRARDPIPAGAGDPRRAQDLRRARPPRAERGRAALPNWDQNATAIEDDYGSQVPSVVAAQLLDAAAAVAGTYAHVRPRAWSRRGLRSNGSEFAVASIAVYHLHDVVHHAHDVDHG